MLLFLNKLRRTVAAAAAASHVLSSAKPTYSHTHRSLVLSPPFSSSSSFDWLWPAASLLIAAGSTSLLHPNFAFSVASSHVRDNLAQVRPNELPSSLTEELKAICGEEGVVLDDNERYAHSMSITNFYPVTNVPDMVVYPRSEVEVVAIVKACNKYEIPIVPYGGATSLEGQVLTPYGGVSIDMSLMKKIKTLHVDDMDVVVEPGIGWIELNEHLKSYGLFFPLDPGPGASIGGMCATRCSGSLAVRYGTMKDNVLSMKAVLANGDVIKTANRARKSAAGYDLTRLMIGSEGTLGVITEVTLRLQKIPEASVVAICSFPSIKDAADVAIATMHSGIQASRLELLDEVMVKALNFANGKDFSQNPTLMLEFIGTDAYAMEQTLRVQKIAEEHKGHGFIFSETPEEKEQLWRMRKEALWACLAMQPDADALTTDVCVPLSRLAECISRTKEETDASFITCATLAHAGDGNVHTLILFDSSKEEEVREAMRLLTLVVDLALEMEGTCTGEHGVGVEKMKYLEKELGVESLKAMYSVKRALDPKNIMNPGKILPHHICS